VRAISYWLTPTLVRRWHEHKPLGTVYQGTCESANGGSQAFNPLVTQSTTPGVRFV